MVYTYHTTIKNKVIEENGVVDFVAAVNGVNTEVGVKIHPHSKYVVQLLHAPREDEDFCCTQPNDYPRIKYSY